MERPRHPYTQLLLSAVPRANPNEERRKVDARGEIPSPINIPNGCRFHARCPYVLAHCGWEGANLARMIRAQLIDDDLRKISSEEAFRVDETGGPSRPLESVQIEPLREIKLHNHGTDLHVTGFRCDAAVVVEALEAVISASLTSIGEAVLGIEKDNRKRIVVRFSQIDEPEFYSIDEQHKVACHLYEKNAPPDRAERVSRAPLTMA